MKHKVLIVYYSHSANTRRLAQIIQQKTKADLWEIKPILPYPVEYHSLVNQARHEIETEYRPPIEEIRLDLKKYDMFIVGSPNWCGTAAPPVLTFLEKPELKGKTILPFCTHGGSGFSSMLYDMEKSLMSARILDGYEAYGKTAFPASIDKWLRENGVV